MGGWDDAVEDLNEAVLDEFGQPVSYLVGTVETPLPNAIFDQRFEELDPGTGATISSERPNVHVRLADLPKVPAAGDVVLVDGEPQPFEVEDGQDDGQGMARLLLYAMDPQPDSEA